MKERIFDEFDEFAENYRKIHTDNIKLSGADSFYFAEMRVKKLFEFEEKQTLKLLDFGCGDGASELFFSKYFSNWFITGIDVSKKSIDEAVEKNIPNTIFEIFNGLEINETDDSFDIVFIAGVLHHVNFSLHNILLKEIYRILKKGGRLYLFEHNPLNPLTKYLVNTCVFDKDAKLLYNSYTKKILTNGQFIVTNNFFFIFFPIISFFKKIIWLEKYLKWLPLGGKYFIRAVKN